MLCQTSSEQKPRNHPFIKQLYLVKRSSAVIGFRGVFVMPKVSRKSEVTLHAFVALES